MSSEADPDDLAAAGLDPERRLGILHGFLSNLFGADQLVLKARKMGVLNLMRSPRLGERILALQRLVFEDPNLGSVPPKEEQLHILGLIEDEVADLAARRTFEEDMDQRIMARMRDKHRDYVKDLRREILREEQGPENAATLKRLAELDEIEKRGLGVSALSVLRPSRLSEVVGQDPAINSLLAKIGTPYPQHVLLYGPPGVGKTTVARLVLEQIKSSGRSPFDSEAPFIEVDATTLRWDPREITNPLLGSVHDPIYQGSRRDLAEDGIPEPKLGLVTKAHGGVLFLDEIGELDTLLLNKLLKVLEDKKIVFESSYFDEEDPRVPEYVRRLFTQGAPADFILIGATTRSPEDIPVAIRSRCAEVFFDPLTATHIQQIVKQASARLKATVEAGVPEEISRYTVEGRKAIQILTDAFGLAWQRIGRRRSKPKITLEDVHSVVRTNRLTTAVPVVAGDKPVIGRIFGLGVSGFLGSCLELEAAAYPARVPGKGSLRFNEVAQESARDSVFNAGSVIRLLLDKDLQDFDVHVNVVGGATLNGPSAGLAISLALVSVLEGLPIPPDLAVTGEVSIQGRVRPVGGVPEKLYGAVQARMNKVLIPWENRHEIPDDLPSGVEVLAVATVEEAVQRIWDRTLPEVKEVSS
ncbi:MAG: ATP-dependent protease, Lon family [Burkholderiales bacterium]|nr:ATP-dependent protease, Lon family [Burkholderiales bacterium]